MNHTKLLAIVMAMVTAVATAALPAREGFDVYTIKKGDTLSKIALTANTSVAELARVNKIRKPNKIKFGTQIYVPAKPVISKPAVGGRTYLVTVFDVADQAPAPAAAPAQAPAPAPAAAPEPAPAPAPAAAPEPAPAPAPAAAPEPAPAPAPAAPAA